MMRGLEVTGHPLQATPRGRTDSSGSLDVYCT